MADINFEIGFEVDQALKDANKMQGALTEIQNKAKINFDTTQIVNNIKNIASSYKTVEEAQKAINKQQGELLKLAKQGLQGTQIYEQTQLELKTRRELLKEMKSSTQEAKNLGNVMEQVNKQVDTISKSNFSNFKSQLGGIGQIAGGLTLAGAATAAIGVVKQQVTESIKLGIDYQASLAEFSAITGVSGEALDKFGLKARELSKTFGGSALEQISTFKGVLSRLGPDLAKSPEALERISVAINTLAQAGGISATEGMDALTTAALQFGVDLKNPIKAADEMTKMMNTMAAGAQVGAAEIPQVKDAIVVAGVAAKGANVSFEETNAAIQVLATGGKYGAEAGTALRNVLGKLAGEDVIPKEAADKLKSLGVNMSVVSDTSLSFEQRLKELSKASGDATAFAQVFGTENAAAASILANGTDKIKEFTKAVTGTQIGFEQAAIIQNTFKAWIERAKAGLEDLKLTLFEGAQKAFSVLLKIGQTIAPYYEGLINGIIAGFKPLYDSIVGLYNEIVKLFSTASSGIDIFGTLKEVFTVLGQIVGGTFKIAIQIVLTPIRLLIETWKTLISWINQGITVFKNFLNSGSPVANFINNLWQGFKNLLGTIGSTVTKILEFLGILDKKQFKAPLAENIKKDTKEADKELDKAVVKTEEKAKKIKDAFKFDSSGITKYVNDVNSNLDKINNETLKLQNDATIKNLETLKTQTLKNETLLGSERLKIAQSIDEKILNEKLSQSLANTDLEKAAAIRASEDKAIAEINKLNETLAKEKNLTKSQKESIKNSIIEISASQAKEEEAIASQFEEKRKNIITTNETEISNLRIENEKKINTEIEKERINLIQNVNDRQKAIEINSAQETYKKRLEEVRGNLNLELQAYVDFLNKKAILEQQNAVQNAPKTQQIALQVTNTLSDTAKNIDLTPYKNQQAEVKKLKDEENKRFEESSKNLRTQLNNQEISYEEYLKKIRDLENDHTDKLKEIQQKQIDGWEIVADIISKTFDDVAKKTAEQTQGMINEYNGLTNAINQQKNIANNALQENGANSQVYQTEVKKLTDLQVKQGETLNQVYGNVAVQVGASFASMITSGENAGKALAKAALSGLKQLVPIIVAEIFGQSLGQLGPIAGAIAAAGLTAAFYGLIAVAESSLGAEKGHESGKPFGRKGKSDTHLIWVNPKEEIFDSTKSEKNRDLFRHIQRTGSYEGFFNDSNIVTEVKLLRKEIKNTKLVNIYDRRTIDINDNRKVQVKEASLYR